MKHKRDISNRAVHIHAPTWPGMVEKGGRGKEPFIPFNTMVRLIASAEWEGHRFDGVDILPFDPGSKGRQFKTDDDLRRLADFVQRFDLLIGSIVALVWPGLGGGMMFGSEESRKAYLAQVRRACEIGKKLRDLQVRQRGIIRVDSGGNFNEMKAANLELDSETLARSKATLREAVEIAEGFGEVLGFEGEICWPWGHSIPSLVRLMEEVDRPTVLGVQADFPHILTLMRSLNVPADATLPANWDPKTGNREPMMAAFRSAGKLLGPWTVDIHAGGSDGETRGGAGHMHTGKHLLPNNPENIIPIVEVSELFVGPTIVRKSPRPRTIGTDVCMDTNKSIRDPMTYRVFLNVAVEIANTNYAKAD